MAPSILETQPVAPHSLSNPAKKSVDRKIFPDGIRTSGQHPPLYDLIRPYSEFPKEITGETVWKAEDYTNNPERWVHVLNEEEIEELSAVADKFLAEKIPLTGISKDNFVLPKLSQLLTSIRREILNGKGFILFKGFPVEKWGNHKSAVTYMGLGTYLGYFVSQNGRGHVLGHVKDLGDDPTQSKELSYDLVIHSRIGLTGWFAAQIDRVRIYRTNARQFFHADDSDIVGLLCIARALEGGESDIVSSHHVWNTLQKERPDIAETLTKPIWYFDRKGEESVGEEPYIRTSVFYLERGENGRVYSKWDPYYIKSLARFMDKGIIPPLSPEQVEAAKVLEETCHRLRLHMILEVGDIQFLSNEHVLHARTEYKDHTPPAPRRHLMRLWLATPESEGGWKLPFHDSAEKKRGGIQVNDNPPLPFLSCHGHVFGAAEILRGGALTIFFLGSKASQLLKPFGAPLLADIFDAPSKLSCTRESVVIRPVVQASKPFWTQQKSALPVRVAEKSSSSQLFYWVEQEDEIDEVLENAPREPPAVPSAETPKNPQPCIRKTRNSQPHENTKESREDTMLPTPSTDHVAFERIYEPAEDSYLLLDTLSSESEKAFLRERFHSGVPSPLVVEIGSGSGVVISFIDAHTETIFGRSDILTAGVDVNSHACSATIQTVNVAEKEQKSQGISHGFYLGNVAADLGSAMKPEEVDVLVFNPPYVPTPDLPVLHQKKDSSEFDRDSHLLSLSYAGGADGMEVTNRLLNSLPEVLSKDRGCAYILLCAQNKPEAVKQQIRSWGEEWIAETVGSSGKKGGWEKLQIVRVWRESSRSTIH
ncbi:hypothetical protein G7Y89_g2601 [Cudoniella acicularis]|uniref:TauD/TfdA-like domain-containing protein n=1 Tax=Cudoniella acicularis TaxID=354080 RepID=A0A8H4W978_9HELO|nr:hypothetical protein G7Y89_g2601 [Cudoniella acicularis]